VIWLLDAKTGEFLYVSPAFEQVLGLPCSGLYQNKRLWLEHIDPQDGEKVARANAGLRRGIGYDVEFRILRPDGCMRWIHNRGYPVRNSGGDVAMVCGVAEDVTERKAMEETLASAKQQAEAGNLAKGAFLAHMSHEMRTPLHVIIGLSEMLRREVRPAQQERIDQICATSDHLLAIINDVLDISKVEAAQLLIDDTDFHLASVVDKVLGMVATRAREKGLDLIAELPPTVNELALSGDPLRLAQVLINLCANAVKFTDAGWVRLKIELLAEDAKSIKLKFLVADSGIGIAAEDQLGLFQPFAQGAATDRGGTGLGLAISRRLVALMGGELRLTSRLGEGSSFSFELNLARATTHPVVEAVASPFEYFIGTRILCADDHPLSQEIIVDMLESLGCDAEVAADGEEAISCARAHHYDLILMDMRLPKVDGLAATRAIRQIPQHQSTPIIALTANAYAEDRNRCLAAGMNGHLGKPVTAAVLAATLSQWLPQFVGEPIVAATYDSPLHRELVTVCGLDAKKVSEKAPEQLADFQALLQRFLAMHGNDIARIGQHYADHERELAIDVAHKLVGMAGFLGARRIETAALDIEQAIKAGADSARITELLAICERRLETLRNGIRL